jgi:magnesium-transporting ATPase (P-type)
MHRGRITLLLVTVILLPVTVALTMVTLRHPHPVFIGMMVASFAALAAGVYRVTVTPDSWYERQETRESKLWQKHVVLMSCLTIFVGISFFSKMLEVLGGWLNGWLIE